MVKMFNMYLVMLPTQSRLQRFQSSQTREVDTIVDRRPKQGTKGCFSLRTSIVLAANLTSSSRPRDGSDDPAVSHTRY